MERWFVEEEKANSGRGRLRRGGERKCVWAVVLHFSAISSVPFTISQSRNEPPPPLLLRNERTIHVHNATLYAADIHYPSSFEYAWTEAHLAGDLLVCKLWWKLQRKLQSPEYCWKQNHKQKHLIYLNPAKYPRVAFSAPSEPLNQIRNYYSSVTL